MELMKKDTVTSLELLEQINFFRKEEGRVESAHSDLLKVIRDEFEDEIGEGKISCTSVYKDSQGKERPMFILTIAQAKQVLVRESKFVRKAVIHKLEELENSFKVPTTFKEALKLALEQQEEIERLQISNDTKDQIILEYTPKVEYVDKILADRKSLLTVTQIAKDYGLSGVSLNNILHENKVQYKQSNTWLLYSNYANKGYTKSTTWDNGGKTGLYTKWTQKGRLFIHELLKKNGIFAIEDQSN